MIRAREMRASPSELPKKETTDMSEKKKKLTEEQVKALLNAGCRSKSWFLMKKSQDYNRLALFLKINGVDKIELGEKAYTYEVDLKDETIAGAFILTEKPWEDGTRWYIAAMTVAPDYRGHKIGSIMFQKIKKLAAAENADAVYVSVPEGELPPDDDKGITDAASFWESQGMTTDDGASEEYKGTRLYSAEI